MTDQRLSNRRVVFCFSSRRRHTRCSRDWSSDVCSSDLIRQLGGADFSREITVRGPEDLQSVGERLDWLRRRLAELEAEKNRFLRHLSHELKTPLTVLREGAELLNDQVGGPLAPPQRQVVSIMRDNSVKLQRLIEDLLDYQRALHAAASLAPKTVALDSLIREVVRPHELVMQANSQTADREFAEAHGGRISVITRTSGGHFRVTLPRKARSPLAAAA